MPLTFDATNTIKIIRPTYTYNTATYTTDISTAWTITTDATNSMVNTAAWNTWAITTADTTFNQWTADELAQAAQRSGIDMTAINTASANLAEERRLADERAAEAQRVRLVVRDRARELLRSILDDHDWADYQRNKSVRVVGSAGGVYEVGIGGAVHVYRLEPGTLKPIEKLCVHPSLVHPGGDVLATLILNLRTDEAKVLRTANKFPFYGDERDRVERREAFRTAA